MTSTAEQRWAVEKERRAQIRDLKCELCGSGPRDKRPLFDGTPLGHRVLCAPCIQPHLKDHPNWVPRKAQVNERTLAFSKMRSGEYLLWLLESIHRGYTEFMATTPDGVVFDWGPHARITLWLADAPDTATGVCKARK